MQPHRSRLDAIDVDTRDLMAVLRGAGGAVPDDHVDWDAFHRRLSACAELPLARLRHPLPIGYVVTGPVRAMPIRRERRRVPCAWWEHAARWSRLTVGSALAAGVALAAVIRLTPRDVVDQAGEAVVMSSAGADGPRAAFESAVIGRTRVTTTNLLLMPSAAELLIPSARGGATP